MAISAKVTLQVLSVELVAFTSQKTGEGVSYTEVIARDAGDGQVVVLRAQDASKFAGWAPGQEVTAQCTDEGAANLRVRKYGLAKA